MHRESPLERKELSSRGRPGQALGPGSLRLTWAASRKHRCQVLSRLGAAAWKLPGLTVNPRPSCSSRRAGSQHSEAQEELVNTAFLSSSSGPQLHLSEGFRTRQAQGAAAGWEAGRDELHFSRGQCGDANCGTRPWRGGSDPTRGKGRASREGLEG